MLEHMQGEKGGKFILPANFPYKEAREFFKNPNITDPASIKVTWGQADEEGIVQFMCRENNFSEDRIRATVRKLSKSKHTSSQGRLEQFFPVVAKAPAPLPAAKSATGAKRKGSELGKEKQPSRKLPATDKKPIRTLPKYLLGAKTTKKEDKRSPIESTEGSDLDNVSGGE
eukprot:comp5206_c0_seq1/m.1249 comp5206_c0_seq1/g.1249  ORF comp5206_c0_seq1/g.1249 comp5206_c0_seq1/m.1249 type:complete len:171 (-) comp5206_c0_seq1:329-841(-)